MRYLELDSTYRNRNLWPKAGEFQVEISQSGTKNRYTALDPVSLAAPLYCWKSNDFDKINGFTLNLSFTPTNTISNTNTSTLLIVEGEIGTIQQETNYYRNAVLQGMSSSSIHSRISSSKYLGIETGKEIMQLTLYTGIDISSITSLSITDPTDLKLDPPQLFIPEGRVGENSYVNYIIYNETRNDYRKISGYSSETHLLSIDISKNNCGNSGPIDDWEATDNYCLRKEPPFFTRGMSFTNTNNNVIYVNPTDTRYSNCNGFYDKLFIRFTNGPAKDEIRSISKYCVGYDDNGIKPNCEPSNPYKKFLLCDSFVNNPGENSTFEILQFSYDNAVPFSYSGSLVSQQEEVCYEIELLNLVLPNTTLSVGQGSRIAFYPYVYVEFTNISGASAGMKNIIYSNNPNSNRALFRCPVTDVNNPIVTNFINLSSDGMVQTVKFKPNDNLKFAVKLPNGEIYDTVYPESYSPYPPVFEEQISACFSIKRVS